MTIQATIDQPGDLDNIIGQLNATGYQGFKGVPPRTNPGDPYWCLFPNNGFHQREGYADIRGQLVEVTFRVVYIANTLEGAISCATAGNNRLLGWRPNSNRSTSPVTEATASGEAITDGPKGDLRTSITCAYHYYTTLENQP